MGLLSKAVSGSSGFEAPTSQGGLLKLVSQKTVPAAENDSGLPLREQPLPVSFPLEKAVTEKLSGAYAKYGAFRGIIIETVNLSGNDFMGRLAFMVSGFGTAQGLSPERCLVLFDSSEDAELIGQHLAKTVPGNIVCSFEAKDPGEAIPLIKPYL
jgi:hypothetical protein